MSRPELISMPHALAVGNAYHQVRIQALDTVVALSAIAGDSSRHPSDVYGELNRSDRDAYEATWWPLAISTSRSELAQVVGGHRRRSGVAERELALLAATRDDDGQPLVRVLRLGSTRGLEVTISAWWHRGVRRGSTHTYIRLDDYARLDAVGRRGYVWLAGWVGISGGRKTRTIHADTLAGHLWADPPATASERRWRRHRTRQMVEDLAALRGAEWQLAPRGDQIAVGPHGAELAPRGDQAPVGPHREQEGRLVLVPAPDGRLLVDLVADGGEGSEVVELF